MDIEALLKDKELCIQTIYDERKKIADYKEQRIKMKAPLWDEATGTVDQKKDYIKSRTSEYDKKIAICEAEIEYMYNEIAIIEDRLVYLDE